MQNNLIMRHKVKHAMRTFLNGHGFIDIETPELCKSTPEGARDYPYRAASTKASSTHCPSPRRSSNSCS